MRRAIVEAEGDGPVRLRILASEDTAMVRWVAGRHVDQFERAFGRRLEIVG